jgi:hypothetical protein
LFDKDQQFKEATTTAIKQSTESLRTLGLPIPAILSGMFVSCSHEIRGHLHIADEIDNTRYQAIDFVVESLHERLERYRSIDYVCPYGDNYSFECGSFLLGNMMKELTRLNLYQPRPEVPFPSLSFKDLCNRVRGIRPACWAPEGHYHSHSCTLDAAMETLIEDVSTAVGGLNLGDLKKRRDG